MLEETGTKIEDVASLVFIDSNSKVLTFVPKNNDGEVCIYHNTIHSIAKIFRSEGVQFEIPNASSAQYIEQRSADIFLPAIFIGFQLYTEKKDIIDICLDLIQGYIEKTKSGLTKQEEPRVEISVYTEETKTKKIKRITYKGTQSGLRDFGSAIKGVLDD